MLRRLPVLLPVLALGAATAVMLPAATGSAAPVATTGKTYVALGDSYAAGYGIPRTATLPDGQKAAASRPEYSGCDQTTGDYPHILATSLGLSLTDVTCSGATTADFSASQDVNTPPGTTTLPNPPPQLDVFRTVQPDLVTVTIGGNDLGFVSIAETCLAGSPDGPILKAGTNMPVVDSKGTAFLSCKDYFATPSTDGGGKDDDPYAKVDGVLAKVDAALKAVHAAAPNAKIAVIAYPAIAPDTANTPASGCWSPALPFTNVDIPYLQVLQQQLDAGIGQTAAANGAAYADIYPSSLSHSACEPESARWVEPLAPDQVVAPGSTNLLHPNVAGTTAMAAALAPVVTTLLAPPATTAPTTPAPTTGASAVSGGGTVLGGAPTLPGTGVDVPVPWVLGLAGVLLAAGGAAMALVRRRPATRG